MTYTIELKANGVHHIQKVEDELDFAILTAVLKKIEREAIKVLNSNSQVIDFVI